MRAHRHHKIYNPGPKLCTRDVYAGPCAKARLLYHESSLRSSFTVAEDAARRFSNPSFSFFIFLQRFSNADSLAVASASRPKAFLSKVLSSSGPLSSKLEEEAGCVGTTIFTAVVGFKALSAVGTTIFISRSLFLFLLIFCSARVGAAFLADATFGGISLLSIAAWEKERSTMIN